MLHASRRGLHGVASALKPTVFAELLSEVLHRQPDCSANNVCIEAQSAAVLANNPRLGLAPGQSSPSWLLGRAKCNNCDNTSIQHGLLPSLQLRFQHTASASHAPHAATDTSGPLVAYNKGLQEGIFRPDPRQAVTVQKLQDLFDQLSTHVGKRHRRRPSGLTMIEPVHGSGSSSTKGSWWGSFTGKGKAGPNLSPGAEPQKSAVQGLYMYGGVGCGKTMLMDLFVKSCPPEFKILRTHFHDFMLDIHKKLRQFKGSEDPLLKVADQIAQHTRVLAMDEFFVTDVADAMILSRLFGHLWDRGLVLVATSNRAPDKLYEGGLQRTLFLPFIHRLKEECIAHDMASATDYRRLAQHQRGLYFTTPSREEDLYEEFIELSHGAEVSKAHIQVMMGRQLEVPSAAGKACMFSFAELCGRAVAAADYLAVAENFHTVALSGVPIFNGSNRSEGYRFVTLVDVMYEHRVRMLMSAEAMPFELFEDILTQQEAKEKPQLLERKDIIVDDNLGFAKDRTISRLTEMQSLEYLMAHAQAHVPENLLALQEAHAKMVAAKAKGHS